jgi:hypothetical protein
MFVAQLLNNLNIRDVNLKRTNIQPKRNPQVNTPQPPTLNCPPFQNLNFSFPMAQLKEFGLDPRDWRLAEARYEGNFMHHLQHRDDEDIQLTVQLDRQNSIQEVELFITAID